MKSDIEPNRHAGSASAGGAKEMTTPRAAANPPVNAPLEQEVHLLDRLSVLHKYRGAVIAVFLLIVGWVMIDSYSTIPLYRATARVQIDDETAGLGTPMEIAQNFSVQDPETYLNTQQRILKGRELGLRVVSKLDIQQVAEFNGRGPQPTAVAKIIGAVKSTAAWPVRAILNARSTPALAPVAVVEPPIAAADAARVRPYVDAFLNRVDVNLIRGSRLVDVSFSSADPAFAARAINVHADEYVTQNLAIKVETIAKSLAWLTAEVARQQQKVESAERALAEYREQQDAGALADNQNTVVNRLNQLNDAVTSARTQRIQRENVWKQIQQAGLDRDTLAAIISSPAVQSLKAQVSALQRDRTRIAERYGEKHPEHQRILSQLADTERQYDAEIQRAAQGAKGDYQAALAQEQSLAAELRSQQTAVTSLNRKNINYSVLQRDAETARQIYNSLLQREGELRVIANSRANNVRLIDRADVPGAPFTPNHRQDWTYALFFGVILAVGAAFALDYLDDTIKTPEDVTRRLKLRFLGLVPSVKSERHPLLSGPVPHDFSEAFRALRTALMSQTEAAGTRIIGVSSAQPLEGKTTTATNMALALAVSGARVLLIDADMRRPSVHKALRLTNDRGLSQLLAGQARMREVVQRTHDPNLLVISAGRTPSNPSELLASDRMRALVGGLETGPFDWVIVDTPPILAVTDAVIVAPLVSAMTLVIGAEMTRWRLADRAAQMLLEARPRAVFAVLNKVDFARNRYYYARYYGHQYKSYYSEAPAA
jgi:capsular exopolysaccharide synthesis family protein